MGNIEIDWENIDSEYKFAAIDKNGDVFLYKCKPELKSFFWASKSTHSVKVMGKIENYKGDWQKSVIERPSNIAGIEKNKDLTLAEFANLNNFYDENLLKNVKMPAGLLVILLKYFKSKSAKDYQILMSLDIALDDFNEMLVDFDLPEFKIEDE